jgi:hypothetical protein
MNENKKTPIPYYGDLFPVNTFVEYCKEGLFINYDGSGYYADEDGFYRDLPALPSQIIKGEINKEFKFVIWFNK